MKTTVERVDDTTVKLSITVEAERVDAAVDAAAGRLAGQVKVPGFRPGRVPRRVLQARLGPGTLLQEAARDALPGFYAEAAQAEELDVVAAPSFDVATFEEGTDAEFTATVEVRPTFDLPDLDGVQVPHPDWEVTDDEVGQQLDALRDRFAELETVQRPAQAGDYVVVTVKATRNGELLEAASAEDLLYAIPDDAATSDSQLDRELLGAEPGAIRTFTDTLGEDYGAELADVEASFTAIVKEVKTKHLPDLDDDFAVTASEFDTIDELRENLRGQLAEQKRAFATAALRGRVVEAITERVDVALPTAMVDAEVRFRLNRMAAEAQQYEMSFEDYLKAAGLDSEGVVAQLTEDARKTVKAQLVVDALGRDAGIDVTQDDLGGEIARQAARLGRPPEELAEMMTAPERIGALVGDAFRRKTIDHLVEQVEALGGPPADQLGGTPSDETPSDETPSDETHSDETAPDAAQ